MAEFAYNNTKNASKNYTFFKLNCNYYSCIFYKKDLNICFQLMTANKLVGELKKLMTLCQKKFCHAQKLQKQANNKDIKPKTYVFGNKIWLNSKYIKTKQNCKLESEFFGPFQILYPVKK